MKLKAEINHLIVGLGKGIGTFNPRGLLCVVFSSDTSKRGRLGQSIKVPN